ncbi:MAG: type IX secretion system membrane protein PorP/SprF [Saprospiraceae bacterium]|nr:type IX secretion system membrane protein PorP/SprF [Saprospiraceae bacterium]
MKRRQYINFLFLIVILFILQSQLCSQQQPMFTKFAFDNNTVFNPASTGRNNVWTSILAYRNQWARVEGAPTTTVINLDGPIQNDRAGLGVNIMHEKIGVDAQTSFNVNYAYHIRLNQNSKLSLGMKAGTFLINSNFANIITPNPDQFDPVYADNVSLNIPFAGIGAMWHSDRWYASLGMPVIVAGGKSTIASESPLLYKHYFFSSGYLLDIGDSPFQVKPFIFVRYQKAAPIQADLNVQFWYHDLFSVGVSYRTGDAISGMAEIALNKQISLSYAYDHTTSRFRAIGSGAHEIILQYSFRQDIKKIQSIHKISNLRRF